MCFSYSSDLSGPFIILDTSVNVRPNFCSRGSKKSVGVHWRMQGFHLAESLLNSRQRPIAL